jgi:hypothetical protein
MDFPDPTPPVSVPATRLRVKWEHVMIALITVAIIAFGFVAWLASSAADPAQPAASAVAPAAVPNETAAVAPAGALTMDDAVGLVAEARSLMGEARWVEAAERLDSVPAELRATSGADALAAELELQRTNHDGLRAELLASVEARQWPEAKVLLRQLAAIAPLDAELLDAQAIVESALAPEPTTPKAAATEDAAAATTAGGGAARPSTNTSSSATPAAATPAAAKPSASRPAAAPKPAAPSTPAASTKPATGVGAGSGTDAAAAIGAIAPGAIALTPAQEAELQAALGALQ